MCQCVSCEYTDNLSGTPDMFGLLHVPRLERWGPEGLIGRTERAIPGFSAWPRGNPKGVKASSDEYKAHAKHCGADGLPRPYRFVAGKLPQFPAWMRGNGPIEQAPSMVLDWINRKEASPAQAEPARPETPAKAPQHLPELDRQREPARIYTMKPKQPRKGRPPLEPGRTAERVLITLDRETVERAKRIGQDNLSAGVREAVRRYKLKAG